jgi:hypothetical protein
MQPVEKLQTQITLNEKTKTAPVAALAAPSMRYSVVMLLLQWVTAAVANHPCCCSNTSNSRLARWRKPHFTKCQAAAPAQPHQQQCC